MYCVAGAPNDVSYEDITHIHVPASKTLCYVIIVVYEAGTEHTTDDIEE